LREAVLVGAVRRIRPKFMTIATMFLGLAPILWSTGAGAEMMKRIAARMVAGLATPFLMELIVYRVLYERWKMRTFGGRSLDSRGRERRIARTQLFVFPSQLALEPACLPR